MLAAVLPLTMACKDQRRHATGSALQLPEGQIPVPVDAGPADVARAFLESVRDAQHAREKGFGRAEQKEAYEKAMSTLRSLAAEDKVFDVVRGARLVTVPKDISQEAAVTLALESWVSVLAYYVDGFLYQTITATQTGPDTANTAAVARLEAERPDDAQRLSKLEAASGPAASQPAGVGGAASMNALRSQALALRPPMNVPIRARIEISLAREQAGWRVVGVQIGPGTVPSLNLPPPTTQMPQPAAPVVVTSTQPSQ